jgi:hypothetical protein
MKKIAFVFASLLAASSAMATETQPVAPQASGGAVAGGTSLVVAGAVAAAAVVTIAKVAGEDSPVVEGPDTGPEVTEGPETTTTTTNT